MQTLPRWVHYVDGTFAVLRRGRVRRFRDRAEALGLGVPPARQVPGGQLVQLGLAPRWPDFDPVVALLLDHNARIDRLELAADCWVPPGLDPEQRLDALLGRLRCRALPDRDWRRPAGCAVRYLAHENAPINAAAYTRPSSKVPGLAPGAVVHVETRLRHHWLEDLGLDDPRTLSRLTEARMMFIHAVLFEMTGTRFARARARTGAVGISTTSRSS